MATGTEQTKGRVSALALARAGDRVRVAGGPGGHQGVWYARGDPEALPAG